jgi:hypothetical protein
VGHRLAAAIDASCDCAVLGFGAGTLWYWISLAGVPLWPIVPISLGAFGAAAGWRLRHHFYPRIPTIGRADLWAVGISLGIALMSSIIVRLDADDASYVARTQWTIDTGLPSSGHDIFYGSGGTLGDSIGPVPYLAS